MLLNMTLQFIQKHGWKYSKRKNVTPSSSMISGWNLHWFPIAMVACRRIQYLSWVVSILFGGIKNVFKNLYTNRSNSHLRFIIQEMRKWLKPPTTSNHQTISMHYLHWTRNAQFARAPPLGIPKPAQRGRHRSPQIHSGSIVKSKIMRYCWFKENMGWIRQIQQC